MFKSHQCRIRTLARLIGAATLFSGAWTVGAVAEHARGNKMTYYIIVTLKSEITVTSSDVTRWDTIVPVTVTFWAHMSSTPATRAMSSGSGSSSAIAAIRNVAT